eukprot:CAMPEP_0184349006 /NCGR_PEP_ID=MMETSP1089-20130417/32100_1 /TAXON_ID=38269 ORGANISM="Gloeochaete wittrockiana, Strain SAG46.84" /NCGR_SAMPLE_ID=MMETSP1089 /ASSEMBLY_ACC=CAM_ASM_000445 /LENGTH=48 /DNA_ID= /DNA_START= /DNA_END= /DNA_ORIENTATION=
MKRLLQERSQSEESSELIAGHFVYEENGREKETGGEEDESDNGVPRHA